MIDLTYPIRPHFRWPVVLSFRGDHANGDVFRITTATSSVHAFTHIDAPRHILADGDTIEQLDLHRTIGWFDILDLSGTADQGAIGPEELAVAAKGRTGVQRWLLKTNWPQRRRIEQREFWLDAPYVSHDGANWLRSSGAQAVAFDFPQDITIRQLLDGGPCPPLAEHATHDILLKNDITLIEYVANTGALTQDRAWICALPLKIEGADGALARIVAWNDEPKDE